MTLRTTALFLFATAFGAEAGAQDVELLDVLRDVSASISAVDAVTNVHEDQVVTSHAYGPFDESIALDAATCPASHVDADASVDQDTMITSTRLAGDGAAAASGVSEAAGAVGKGNAQSRYLLNYSVTARVRVTATATVNADSTIFPFGWAFGEAWANVQFDGPCGEFVRVDAAPWNPTQTQTTWGWLQPGDYAVNCTAGARADAHASISGESTADYAFDVRFFCAADYTADGVVDSSDVDAYVDAYDDQVDSADIDGDGEITPNDLYEFMQAYAEGCGC